jgi:hypothetical protein
VSIIIEINGEEISLTEYYGWSEPGRTPEIDWINRKDKNKPPLTLQLLEISEYLVFLAKTGRSFTSRGLEKETGYTANAWRQIRPIMNKIGFLTTKISENKKIDTLEPISKKGIAYNKATKRRLEDESNYKELLEIQRQLWSMILMSYRADKPEGLFPVRAIIKTLTRNKYLDRVEWDIMTTFITENDNNNQELIVDTFINRYRNSSEEFIDITKVPATKKGPKTGRLAHELNRNTYTKNLLECGLIVKSNEVINGEKTEVIKLNYNNDMVNLIVSDDFYNKLQS